MDNNNKRCTEPSLYRHCPYLS